MNVSFLGAAGTVTGSKHLVTIGSKRVLVDCGLFQGLKALRRRNRDPLPFDPKGLDAVVLTHAHLDHSGFLPVLVREGFTGPIYCTEPTADLVPILLADSGHIQEEDARYANRKGFSRHTPAVPLYTEQQARTVTPQLRPVPTGETVDADGLRLAFRIAGHILGAAGVLLESREGSIYFSGDLGRPADPLIPAPEPPPLADWIVMESTYGGREHAEKDILTELGGVLKRTAGRGGVLMIPAFAVGRSQLILYAVAKLFEAGAAPKVPVFLNSPMAINVTELYLRHDAFHRLTADQCSAAFSVAEYVRKAEQSKRVNQRRGPMVLIAGAGMLSGGRILHHLKAFGGDDRSTILLTGHQAAGTRGASLLRGEPELKIHGRWVPIHAAVDRLDGLSAHADQSDLLDWLEDAPRAPEGVFLVHGELEQAEALRQVAQARLGARVSVAQDGATEVLS